MFRNFYDKHIDLLSFVEMSTKALKKCREHVCEGSCRRFNDGTCDIDRCSFYRLWAEKLEQAKVLEENSSIKAKSKAREYKDRFVKTNSRPETIRFFKKVKHSVTCALKRETDLKVTEALNKVYKFAEKKNKQMTIYYINKSGLDCLMAIVNKHSEVKV